MGLGAVSACCSLDSSVLLQLFCNVGNGEMAEHSLDVPGKECSPILASKFSATHKHGPDCGHERVRHGDHYDYLVR